MGLIVMLNVLLRRSFQSLLQRLLWSSQVGNFILTSGPPHPVAQKKWLQPPELPV